jgi:hypothetical protein
MNLQDVKTPWMRHLVQREETKHMSENVVDTMSAMREQEERAKHEKRIR